MSVKMTERQIRDFISEWTWGTLIAVDGDRPYAIELAYATDGRHIYCGSRSGGKMAKCIKHNQNIMFKVCDVENNCTTWRAVSVFAKAEQLIKREDFLYMIKLVDTCRKMGLTEAQFESFADGLDANPEAGGPIRIAIENLSGRASF